MLISYVSHITRFISILINMATEKKKDVKGALFLENKLGLWSEVKNKGKFIFQLRP